MVVDYVKTELRKQGIAEAFVKIDFEESGSFGRMRTMLQKGYHILHLDMHGIVCEWDEAVKRGAEGEWMLKQRENSLGDLREWRGEQAVLCFEELAEGWPRRLVPITPGG